MNHPVFQVHRTAKIYEPVAFVKANHEIRIGKNCSIGQFTYVGARKFVMEECSEVGPQVTIGGGGNVTLEYGSVVNYGAKLIPGTFLPSGKFMNDRVNQKHTDAVYGDIIIEKGAVIGAGAVICVSLHNPEIRIGRFAIVGANSYVNCDVRPGMLVHPKIKYDVHERRNGDSFLKKVLKHPHLRKTL
jgi:acetyltransferase-like isoleucine patch superfamily enzyme